MTQPKLKSIHKTPEDAQRSAGYWGGTVKQGVPGTTAERPWGVVAEAPEQGNKSSTKWP
jgi:hypothetical protein